MEEAPSAPIATLVPPIQAPLNCTVCPKKPKFSDVSHLLTHVASKGHLSHYYKLKIKAAEDDASRAVLEGFDIWYADFNVERLMSERMQSKDKKKPKRRDSAPVLKIRQEATKPKRRQTATGVSPSRSEVDHPAHPDAHPQLAMMPNPFVYAPLSARHNRPRLYLWDTKRPASFDALPLEPSSSSSPTRLLFPPQVPLAPMISPTHGFKDEEQDALTEATKLKGVFWPGMDIFDAATPNTKRRRNQKKDTSVAESLQRHSVRVEGNEVIFTPLGTMKKSRYINGQIYNDSSPYKLDLPSTQPKRRQGRKALAEKDKNAMTGRKRHPSVSIIQSGTPIPDATSSTQLSQPLPPPLKKRKRAFKVFDERDEDERPPMGRAPKKAYQGLDASPFSRYTGMQLLNSSLNPSPPFDTDGTRSCEVLKELQDAQPSNRYFADAFGHYQPAYMGMPYYGYGYYGHPAYNMAGYMPLPAQHNVQPRAFMSHESMPAPGHVRPGQALMSSKPYLGPKAGPTQRVGEQNPLGEEADEGTPDLNQADKSVDDDRTIPAGGSELT